MSYARDREQARLDREFERRLHHDEFVKRKPEYLDLERQRVLEAMAKALNDAEQKALNRRFDVEPAPVSAFADITA
jgi:hypothetical protein